MYLVTAIKDMRMMKEVIQMKYYKVGQEWAEVVLIWLI